jgi:Lrp/AsnC family transcriptional regulator for asnA, asnC and gidA
MVRHGTAPYGTIELDDIDRQIIHTLSLNARASYTDMGKAAGISPTAARARFNKLIRTGALFLVLRMNPAAFGFGVDAMVGIRCVNRTAKEVGAQLVLLDEVSYVGFVTGGFDIIIEVFVRDNDSLFQFLHETLDRIGGIAATETWTVLRTQKFSHTWTGGTYSLDAPDAEDAPALALAGERDA